MTTTLKTEDLRRLEDSILTIATRLDDVIDDNFVIDGTVAPAEDAKGICKKLTNAWREMDEALDEIKFLIKEPTRLENQRGQDEPVPALSEETFRSMLRSLTPETTVKNLEVLKAIMDKAKEIKNVNADLIPTYAALLLIEYGKQISKKEPPQEFEIDSEGRKWDKIPW